MAVWGPGWAVQENGSVNEMVHTPGCVTLSLGNQHTPFPFTLTNTHLIASTVFTLSAAYYIHLLASIP